jgi:tetratricopeptide (TPR) repeat protein
MHYQLLKNQTFLRFFIHHKTFHETTMKLKQRILISLVATLMCSLSTIYAQPTTVFTEANLAFKRGMDFYDKAIYTAAMQELYVALTQLRPAPEPEARLLRGQAELFYAKSAVRSGQPNGEQLMLDYIRKYAPDAVAGQAAIEMGDYYFAKNKPDKAIAFYDLIEGSELPAAERDELYFKRGYALFTQKKFKDAKGNFSKIKDDKNGRFYNETNYYYGVCAFFENNLEEASRSFQRIQSSKQYAAVVPSSIVQIYAAQRDWDNTIRSGLRALDDSRVKNRPQISQLIGQAYFEKKQYDQAEKYLVEAASSNAPMRTEDYYQLGFCQHRTQRYAEAARSLENLSGQNSKLAQHGLYLLGDCYLRMGERTKAKNAFSITSRMNYDPSVQEESQWNYAKLAYESKQTQEAVDALQAIPQSSKNYTEAQNLLSEVLLQTRDFDAALNIINKTGNKTPRIREAAQKALTYRAMQLMQGGDANGAKSYFERSLSDAPDAVTRGIANYWLGQINHEQKNYEASQKYMGTFLALAKTTSGLPSESSVYTANYIQGYNFLKQKNYTSAQQYFQETVNGIKRDYDYISSDNVKIQILGDATLRLGDCNFKRNKYDEAIKYYDEAINKNYTGFVYALFQKGVIQGLRGNNLEKIIALEKLTNNYPNSEYAGVSLLEIGSTYLSLNQLDKAQDALNKVVANFKGKPEVVPALLKLGLIAQNKGNNEQAISYYKQVFYNSPNAVDSKAALERLQDIYVNDLGKPDEYFAFLQTIPGYKPDQVEQESVTYRAAEVQYEQGNYDRAIASFTSYLGRFPNATNTLNAYYYRGECYAANKDFDNAFTDYEAVVLKGPSKFYAKATEKAALIAYNHKKDFTKALNLFTQMEKSATDDLKRFDAELGAMRSAYRLNRTDAVVEFASKVANNSRATKDQVAAANFYLGKIAFDKNDFDRAQQAMQQTMRNGGNDEQTAEAKYIDALVDYKKRNLDVALNKADKASQNNSFVYWAAKCVILQADIFSEKNDLINARAALESIIDGVKEYPEIVAEAKQKLDNLSKKEALKSRINKEDKSGLLDMEKN